MNEHLIALKKWYEIRPTRERLLILFMGWVILYALFYFIFFASLDAQTKTLQSDITTLDNEIKSWNGQISALQQIANTPLYKKWLAQQQLFINLRKKYKNVLQASSTKQWQDVVKTILQSQNNITLVQIKDFPETAYNPSNLPVTASTLYEQKLLVVIYSNFFDTVNYIQRLEAILPNIHWDSLNYEVVQYPVAKIEMEFSIFYDKSTT